ncbi:MAG: tetratricopeptide repeat protein [Thiotrichales bacterium]|nr:tetratricopeptide repeat protein [Thiotrichales bacterium]
MRRRQNAYSMPFILMVVGLISVSGCTTQSFTHLGQTGNGTPSYSSPAPAPLNTEVDAKAEYRLMMDLAAMELKQQRYEQAEPLLQQLRKIHHEDLQVYRMLAQAYEGQAKYHLALLAWRQIAQSPEHTVQDEGEFARLALMEKQYVLAEGIYQKWLQSDLVVRRVSGLNNLGFSRLLQKDFGQARSYFNQALKLDPLSAKALNNLILLDTLSGG